MKNTNNSATLSLITGERIIIYPRVSLHNELFLKRVNELIEANLEVAGFRNKQLAENLLMSETKLFRKLKSLTNKSVAIYIRSIRLGKAKELLLNSDMTVSEVAYKSGFNDPFYFSRTFSREFGYPPSKVRDYFSAENSNATIVH